MRKVVLLWCGDWGEGSYSEQPSSVDHGEGGWESGAGEEPLWKPLEEGTGWK